MSENRAYASHLSHDELHRAVESALERAVGNRDPRFLKLCKYDPFPGVYRDDRPGQASVRGTRDAPATIRGDTAEAWKALTQAVAAWRRALDAGKVEPVDPKVALDTVFRWAYPKRRANAWAAIRKARTDKDGQRSAPAEYIDEISYTRVDEWEAPTGSLDFAGPRVTVFAWLGSPDAQSHSFPNTGFGGVISQVGRLIVEGNSLDDALDSYAADSGLSHAQVRRIWNTGTRRILQILYLIGALGPRAAFRSVKTLQEVLNRVDKAYFGAWTGHELSTLKLAATASTPSDEGAQVRPRNWLALLNTRTREVTAALNRMGPVRQEAEYVSILHGLETDFSKRMNRCDPICVLNGHCEDHAERLAR